MKLLSRSALIATAAAAGFVAAAVPASACGFAKGSSAAGASGFDAPSGLIDNVPDGKTLGLTLGGFGIVASLLTGGVMFYRKQRLVRLAEQESAIATEFEITETVAEEPVAAAEAMAETEKDVVLTR